MSYATHINRDTMRFVLLFTLCPFNTVKYFRIQPYNMLQIDQNAKYILRVFRSVAHKARFRMQIKRIERLPSSMTRNAKPSVIADIGRLPAS